MPRVPSSRRDHLALLERIRQMARYERVRQLLGEGQKVEPEGRPVDMAPQHTSTGSSTTTVTYTSTSPNPWARTVTYFGVPKVDVLHEWRVGRSLGRTIYIQDGDDASKDDLLIGMMDTPELAELVVAAVNRYLGQTQ